MQDCYCTHIVKVDDAEHHQGLELLEKETKGPGPEKSSMQVCHEFFQFRDEVCEKVEKEVEAVEAHKDDQVDQG